MATREHGTLVANTVSTVTVTAEIGVNIILFNHGTGATDEIYYDFGAAAGDITDPVLQADGTRVCPAGGFRKIPGGRADVVVKLRSTGTPRFSLERINESEL